MGSPMGSSTRTAFVTGAGRGIGRTVLDLLVADGWQVAAADIDEQVLGELEDLEGVLPVRCDVADPDSVNAASPASSRSTGATATRARTRTRLALCRRSAPAPAASGQQVLRNA